MVDSKNYPFTFDDIDVRGDPMKYSRRGGKLKHIHGQAMLFYTNTPIVHESPEGYPMLARFIAASEEHYIFRQFRYLQSRVLLHLQDDLRSWEARLWRMDEYDKVHRPTYLKTREKDDRRFGERGKMIEEIHKRLLRYGSCSYVLGKKHGDYLD